MLGDGAKKGVHEELAKYLSAGSNLPGPRANLELGEAFAEVVTQLGTAEPDWLWDVCKALTSIPEAEAPSNSAGEFLVFSGVRGLGALASISDNRFDEVMPELRRFANDGRWRVREAVAIAIQHLLQSNAEDTIGQLKNWARTGTWFEKRAVVAGIAEPSLLKNARMADAAFALHVVVLQSVARANHEEKGEFRVLRQSLGYTLSVIGLAKPKETFALMRKLARSKNADFIWVVKENLKKDRLRRNFPTEVAVIADLLT
jgi:hypothetical protein